MQKKAGLKISLSLNCFTKNNCESSWKCCAYIFLKLLSCQILQTISIWKTCFVAISIHNVGSFGDQYVFPRLCSPAKPLHNVGRSEGPFDPIWPNFCSNYSLVQILLLMESPTSALAWISSFNFLNQRSEMSASTIMTFSAPTVTRSSILKI